MKTKLFLGLSLIGGCGWNHLPTQSDVDLGRPLWDEGGVIAREDGLYIPLPYAGGIVRVPESGPDRLVGIGEGRLRDALASPDGTAIAAFVDRFSCPLEDPAEARKVDLPADCPHGSLEIATEIVIVRGGRVETTADLDGPYNTLQWSPDGAFLVAWLDLSKTVEIEGLLDLNSVRVVDAAGGAVSSVPIGFAARQIRFAPDGSRAVVLSQSAAAIVDLAAGVREARFSLTLDPDQVVEPVGVALTPDSRYALISVQGSADLYALDLENPSVNLVSLAGYPASMLVSEAADRTVLVYGGSPTVEILEHEFFEITRIALDEPMTGIVEGDGFALLYREGSRDVYRLSLPGGDLVEYRLQAPLGLLRLSEDGRSAVALTGEPGLEILDLASDRGRTAAYLTESAGLDVAFAGTSALVLQEGVDTLYALDLVGGGIRPTVLEAPPVSVGALPAGGFYVTHDRALGLITFLDAAGEVSGEASGFGALGIADPIGFAGGVR